MAYKTFKLPEDLLMGSATAATHIEGGEQPHNWYRWSELGKIQDGSHSKVACDHINHIKSDVFFKKNYVFFQKHIKKLYGFEKTHQI